MLYPLLFVIANYAILYSSPANVLNYTIGFDLLALLLKHLYDAYFGRNITKNDVLSLNNNMRVNLVTSSVCINGVVMFFALKSISLASNTHDSTRRSEILSRGNFFSEC